MSAMARPARKSRKRASPTSRLRRAADISLIVLALAAIGLFVAVKFIGGRPGDGKAANGANGANGAGAVAASSSIGPEGAPGPAGDFADLEAGPDEFEGDGDDEPLAGPAIVSDPYAARPFSPVDDPRLAAVLDPEIERSLKVGRIPSMAVVCVSGDRVVWTRSAGLAMRRVRRSAASST